MRMNSSKNRKMSHAQNQYSLFYSRYQEGYKNKQEDPGFNGEERKKVHRGSPLVGLEVCPYVSVHLSQTAGTRSVLRSVVFGVQSHDVGAGLVS